MKQRLPSGSRIVPIPGFSYDLLWGERSIVSVANPTRDAAGEFLAHDILVHFAGLSRIVVSQR